MPKNAEPSGSLSVKVLLESLLENVLVCPPLGSAQRAESHVGFMIDLEGQGDGLLLAFVASLARARRTPAGLSG